MNPIVWLHLRLGGTRTHYLVPIIFTCIVLLASTLSFQIPGSDASAINMFWIGILSAGQAVFLLIVSPASVRKSVLRDFQTGMMESHRVTPMSNLRLVLGYLLGAPLQPFLLYATAGLLAIFFLVNLAASLNQATLPGGQGLAALPAGTMLQVVAAGWALLQAGMLMLAFMISALGLLAAIASSGKANVLGVLIFIGAIGGWIIVPYVPGLALLAGIASAETLASSLAKGALSGDVKTIFTGGLAQTALACTFVAAACRMVRCPEQSLFGIPLGLIVLALSGACLVLGVSLNSGGTFWPVGGDAIAYPRVVASTGVFVLIALLPLSAAALHRFHEDRARALSSSAARGLVLSAFPLVLGAAALGAMALMVRVSDPALILSHPFLLRPQTWIVLAAALLLNLWTAYQLLYLGHSRVWRTWTVSLPILVGLSVGPMLIDGAIYGLAREIGEFEWTGFGVLSHFSPYGLIALLPMHGASTAVLLPWLGLVVQAGLALVATWLARTARAQYASGLRRSGTPAVA